MASNFEATFLRHQLNGGLRYKIFHQFLYFYVYTSNGQID